ncbi:tryptophan 2,3-dioxygenase family protein [Demetria terragena]|uniref:tryptophan 2,3-dioxygenase n=1 Tax=Demetria terragena TaxID=63959 RepID=UPI001FDEB73E
MSYGDYLGLDRLLSAQTPLAEPPQHDELLFIIQHQTSELWLKLVLHELRAARENFRAGRLADALKQLARVKHIQATLTEQWSVLATLTPSEYAQFRDFLATSSGFQSYQYRAVEFLLGNKNARMIPVFDHDPPAQRTLQELLDEPSLYDEFIALLASRGFDVPAELLDRDWSLSREPHDGLIAVMHQIYADPHAHWDAYETCEELVDLEDNFQLWRFRHLKTVERIIGTAPGTGGSSGVPFLRKALEQSFFPELYAVRGQIAQG